ncbi:MAG: DNA-processing protein DprA [Candidatus Pacebacteria bacterium]|nr:DNA-processing protein DprA [Candidatus Paceibacterota bacterium]MBP9840437.1 DNA-processing protein DprA [Candidatus Paceibacterota bacterium]
MAEGLRQLEASEYPALLREIPDAPPSLWLRGTLAPEGTTYLAVVGSRALSSYGREACTKLITGLRGYPVSIVSGLALGADACAHEAALRTGLHTIAIPGSAIDDDSIAPVTNQALAKRILGSGGALLSEHAPGTLARPEFFPSRNRIMAGMSAGTLIIEAGEKSGTLITARLATDYNRDLLCVPYRIGDPGGFGAHLFIRLGAVLVSEPAHILEVLGIQERSALASPSQAMSDDERVMHDALVEPLSRDDLLRATSLPAGRALSALASLELNGFVREEFGLWRRV